MYECIMYVQNLGMAFRAWSLLPMAPGFQQGWSNKKLFIPLFRRFQTGTLWFRLTLDKPNKRGWFSGKSPTATLHPPSCIKHHVMQGFPPPSNPSTTPIGNAPMPATELGFELSNGIHHILAWGCSAALWYLWKLWTLSFQWWKHTKRNTLYTSSDDPSCGSLQHERSWDLSLSSKMERAWRRCWHVGMFNEPGVFFFESFEWRELQQSSCQIGNWKAREASPDISIRNGRQFHWWGPYW